MNPQDLIRKKRDGGRFTPEDVKIFIRGVIDGSWTDYQIAALVMAMYINGLSLREQNSLTEAMLRSGEVFDFSDLGAPVADKHSTGGVGDKTSLIIAPLAAACGLLVPMISGRGLGHTGGTLDKLESIPGYNVGLSGEKFKQIIKKCGFAMAGQTDQIVPADKKLYALRDATATIESIPMIVGSIMSKKLAEGLDCLVLDVKTGTGAFMQSEREARRLAKALVKTGKSFGVRTEALITDMNQPLGHYVGNSLEVYECVRLLRNEVDKLNRPTLALAAELTARLLVMTGTVSSNRRAKARIREVLENGEALERFRKNVRAQGGKPGICDRPEILLDNSLLEVKIKSPEGGFILGIDAREIGRAVSMIGGGRLKPGDPVDHAVGYACDKKLGDRVKEHEPLGRLFCRTETQAAKVLARLQMAYKIGLEKNVRRFELVKEIVA
ncbi:MAG: thymidine phosphorylase [Pyrinomonadaceae bacterium]